MNDAFKEPGKESGRDATIYVLTESDAAMGGRIVNASADHYVLVGPVIISGITDGDDLADVPARLTRHFDALPIRPTGRDL